ncbi:hypothetical protein ACT4S2_17680 [Kocuria turfanensis]|uniref:hypothetical protein n=1 Tax=Kocuria turfanensis TaxID=388357 RepID=UPI00403597A4
MERGYAGDPGTRQQVHTVHVLADAFDADLPRQRGRRARGRREVFLLLAGLRPRRAPPGELGAPDRFGDQG